jgi:hypothetical protein
MYKYREECRLDLSYRICVFHKRRNFHKHVDRVRVALEVRDQALRLFDHICSRKTEDEFNDGMYKLQHLLPNRTDSLRHEIYEFRSLFTEGFRGKSFILDYRATSLGKSANAMIVCYLSG